MLGTFIQIDTKEALRTIFDTAWWFFWTFKWFILPIIIIPLVIELLVKFLGKKKVAIIIWIILILAIVAFFIWLYS